MISQSNTKTKVSLKFYLKNKSFIINFVDGDLITIFDSSDLSFAIQYSRVLKLQILLNNQTKDEVVLPSMKQSEVFYVKQELRNIRDQVNRLLDTLDSKSEVTSSTEESKYQNNCLARFYFRFRSL